MLRALHTDVCGPQSLHCLVLGAADACLPSGPALGVCEEVAAGTSCDLLPT